MVTMDSQYTMTKYSNNPVIDMIPDGYTKHVRDPKVWKNNDTYYMLLGAQRENKTGTLLLYKSLDLYNWIFQGEIKTNLKEFGFMWECPDYFQLSKKDVLLFSPQGIERDEENFQNVYNVVYAIGNFDIENLYFHIDSYYEVDKGFDFYAPQTLEDQSGRRLLFAWAGSSEITYPSDDYMWAHCLTLPRELALENNILKQKPVSELKKLRTIKKEISGDISTGLNVLAALDHGCSYELIATLKTDDANKFGLSLFHNEEESFPITFNREKGTVSIDRSNFHHQFGGEYGYERCKKIDIRDTIELRIFVDNSIVEIFLYDGSTVFTSRVFPRKDITHHIAIFSDAKLNFTITQYKLKRGIV
jgi:beta-fructofuranosidase